MDHVRPGLTSVRKHEPLPGQSTSLWLQPLFPREASLALTPPHLPPRAL